MNQAIEEPRLKNPVWKTHFEKPRLKNTVRGMSSIAADDSVVACRQVVLGATIWSRAAFRTLLMQEVV